MQEKRMASVGSRLTRIQRSPSSNRLAVLERHGVAFPAALILVEAPPYLEGRGFAHCAAAAIGAAGTDVNVTARPDSRAT